MVKLVLFIMYNGVVTKVLINYLMISEHTEVIMAKGSSSKNAPSGEDSNVVGNSIGAYDFNLGLVFNNFNLNIYRIFYLEDKVPLGLGVHGMDYGD